MSSGAGRANHLRRGVEHMSSEVGGLWRGVHLRKYDERVRTRVGRLGRVVHLRRDEDIWGCEARERSPDENR